MVHLNFTKILTFFQTETSEKNICDRFYKVMDTVVACDGFSTSSLPVYLQVLCLSGFLWTVCFKVKPVVPQTITVISYIGCAVFILCSLAAVLSYAIFL